MTSIRPDAPLGFDCPRCEAGLAKECDVKRGSQRFHAGRIEEAEKEWEVVERYRRRMDNLDAALVLEDLL